MEPPVATLSPQAATRAMAAPAAASAASNLPRLPPISSLLASIERRHEQQAGPARPANREDVRQAIDFAQPWATCHAPATAARATYTLTAPRSPPLSAAAAVPRRSSLHPPSPPSRLMSPDAQHSPHTAKNDMRRLAPISTTNLLERPYASSVRSSPDDMHDRRSPDERPRPRSMQLVSPTGGPLHPLPSGLVGGFSPSLSQRPLDSRSPGGRPRSNSVSGATAAGTIYGPSPVAPGPWHSPSDERRASASWIDQSTRKRTQDDADSALRIHTRPRTSLPGSEHYRHAYIPDMERFGASSIGRASFSTDAGSSVTSSPQTNQGPSRRGSTVESMGSPDSLQSLAAVAAAERSELAAAASSPQLGGPARATAHLSPELAGLRISSSDNRRSGIHQETQHQRGPAVPATANHTWSGPSSANAQSFAAPAVATTTQDSMADVTMESGRYVCPHCPKRFARPSSLRTHIHSHTGEKPFSCEHCGRGFSVHSNLRRHLKIHRGNKLAGQTIAEDGSAGSPGGRATGPASHAASDEDAGLSETGSTDSVKDEVASPPDHPMA
ncbi:hypothetical protein OIV83_005990 [Microbotryomycetes sp. JL201]|nr:hypothetical protein OIV83_005990 [Microbotryomycetes sp. JL201]